MKKAVYILVNLVCLLLVILVWCHGEIKYLESKVDYFDRLAEEYRVMLHPMMPFVKWTGTSQAKGVKLKWVLPDFE